MALHGSTPQELRERIAAERGGTPFLILRDDAGRQRLQALADDATRLRIGRSADNDVVLEWDALGSRVHAALERVGDHWFVTDDGLSRNGTFVGRERVSGRRRLDDGDAIRIGGTTLVFRRPGGSADPTTRVSDERRLAAEVTPAQRRVLVALCRPFARGADYALPASNREIAEELVLTVAAVKTHLRALSRSFGIEHLPQQEKRLQLAALAFATGVVTDRDLGGGD
jgi:pSer/pThr/pTyr-binding forkhead associated (FHA) protein